MDWAEWTMVAMWVGFIIALVCSCCAQAVAYRRQMRQRRQEALVALDTIVCHRGRHVPEVETAHQFVERLALSLGPWLDRDAVVVVAQYLRGARCFDDRWLQSLCLTGATSELPVLTSNVRFWRPSRAFRDSYTQARGSVTLLDGNIAPGGDISLCWTMRLVIVEADTEICARPLTWVFAPDEVEILSREDRRWWSLANTARNRLRVHHLLASLGALPVPVGLGENVVVRFAQPEWSCLLLLVGDGHEILTRLDLQAAQRDWYALVNREDCTAFAFPIVCSNPLKGPPPGVCHGTFTIEVSALECVIDRDRGCHAAYSAQIVVDSPALDPPSRASPA